MRRDDRNADVQLDLVIRVYFVLIGISMVGFVGLPIAHLAGWLPDGVGLVGFDIALATLIASQVVGLVGIAEILQRLWWRSADLGELFGPVGGERVVSSGLEQPSACGSRGQCGARNLILCRIHLRWSP